MSLYRRIREAIARQMTIPGRLDQIQEALGRIESRQQAVVQRTNPRDYEFKVYSQWGEDGIIDHLIASTLAGSRNFVEFGVQGYVEANTLFLLKHRQWRGLVIDASPQHIDSIRRSDTYWRYDLYADCSFITKDNINDIISRNGFSGDLGVLSIDIDGNDYWIWEAIEVAKPRIVVSEYNSLFGPTATVSIPYQADFNRHADKASMGYFGASIAALDHLAREKGYALVAGNSAGNNVFFVRHDCLGALQVISPEAAYVRAAFREDRSSDGEVELLRFDQRRSAIDKLPVVDVTTGQEMLISRLPQPARPT